MSARILVAGLGNIFLGDDAFGVDVAHRLAGTLPSEVAVMEVGVRSLHLAHALLDRPELLLVVDAIRAGDTPGTLTLVEPLDLTTPAADDGDGHRITLGNVLAALRSLGGTAPSTALIACEPASTTIGLGLSPVVEHAVCRAEELVRAVIDRHLHVDG